MNRRVRSLALPAAFKQLLDIAQILTDMLMVGSLGVAALAGVGLSMQFMMFIQGLMGMYAVGSSAMISRYVGGGRYKRAETAVFSGFILSSVLAVIVSVAAFGYSEKLFYLLGAEPDVVALGSGYFQILSLGLVLIFLDTMGYSALSSAGDTATPLYIRMFSIGINIGLNYLLIFGHGGFSPMGVEGAAYATLCAYGFNVLAYGWLLLGSRGAIGMIPIVRISEIRTMIKIGFPSALERVIGSASFMLFVMMIASFGTEALAGYQIGLRIEAVAFMPGYGFSVAAMVLAGQYIGAKEYENAYKSGWVSSRLAIYFMGLVGVVLIVFPEFFIRFFTNDVATIESARHYLIMVGIAQVPLALTFVLSGALRGAGATKTTMEISLGSLWLFRILPSFAVVSQGGSLFLVYLIMTIETFIKGGWFGYVYHRRNWLKKVITPLSRL